MVKKYIFQILLILLSVFAVQLVYAQTDTYAIRMAESIMNRNPGGYGSWNYETGTVLRGFEELYRVTGDERFHNYIKSTVDNVVNSNGSISGYSMSEYNLDQIKEGSAVLYLYGVTGDQRYRSAADTLMRQLDNQPQTSDGGNWHKNKYPNQMWLDGLYMAQPFNAQYGLVFNQSANFDDVVLQLTLMENHARDSNTGLLYHGWDESRSASWADPSTGTSPEFWGRSLGWYMMALVDVLDFIPQENTVQRDTILAILNRLVPALADVQDQASGVWWQVIDKGGQSGNWQESSCTAMFIYSIAKAVRNNYIDESYLSVVQKAWDGLINEFVTTSGSNLNLIDTCEGTGVGGSYSFYIERAKRTNDPKGLGPFLMAGVEVELSDGDFNWAPRINEAINDMRLLLNDPAVQIDLNTVFIDPDDDTLSFSHSASSGTDNNVSLSGSILTITPNELGSVVHSVTANDGNGGSTTLQFTLTVTSSYSGEQYSVILQAEDQTWSNATVDTSTTGYNGTGYVNTANNISEWVEFSVSLPSTDIYQAGLRYNSRTNSALEVRVNGELQISNLNLPSTGSWSSASWSVLEFSLQLQAGDNQIRFVALNRRGVPNLDELSLLGGEVSPNHPPTLIAPIGSQSLIQGEPALYIDLNNVFSDPDGDSLSFSVSISANASISGNELVLESSVSGSENLIVTADDNRGGIATDLFDFTVTGVNQAPVVQSAISDIMMTIGDSTISINLNDVFSDPDGDNLSFSHVAENTNDSNVQLNGSVLEVMAAQVSTVSHTVYANDGNGGQAETTFVVNVVDVVDTGDVNGDGSINIVDALLVAQHYVGITSENFDITVADTNCDNNVNIVDALIIAQYFVGLISSFCN